MSRILLVDDDRNLRGIVAEVVKQAGFDTAEADNGLDALSLLGQLGHVDAIISDVQMPKMDGKQLLEELRHAYPAIPVIILSVHPAAPWLSSQEANDNVYYLPKPFARQQLLTVLHRAVSA
jgi:CheY-like chemotaxis protein